MSGIAEITHHQLSHDGFIVGLVSYGASICDIRVKDIAHPLVLGLKNPDDYRRQSSHLGATAGRVANRIAKGAFDLNGQSYQLDQNENGRHMLHGGAQGCGVQNWQFSKLDKTSALLTLQQPDGWMGFPGNVTFTTHYEITGKEELTITYSAKTDRPCPINLAHHSYFKLDEAEDIRHHLFQIEADHYLPVNEDNIPTGTIAPVAGTKFDFTSPRLLEGNRFDHNFCLKDAMIKERLSRKSKTMRKIAFVQSQLSGISLSLYSDQQGVQFYTAHNLHEDLQTIHNRPYHAYDGFCLEPQIWPDACNHDAFPSSIIAEDETYHQSLRLVFEKGRSL